MNPAKLMTEPLLDLVSIATLVWAFTRVRHGSRSELAVRRGLDAIGACIVLLAFLSLPVTAHLAERTLLIDYPEAPSPPDVIVVLSGAYGPETDVLSADSRLRVLAGVEWWKLAPNARIVMAGEAARPDPRGPTLITRLMTEVAEKEGVPASRIQSDTWSVNTRTHPLGLLRLPGITPDTKIGLVTSPWHLRRATGEFRRHFHHVQPWYPRRAPPTLQWEDFVPQVQGLMDTTTMLHEWLGIAWYRLLHTLGR